MTLNAGGGIDVYVTVESSDDGVPEENGLLPTARMRPLISSCGSTHRIWRVGDLEQAQGGKTVKATLVTCSFVGSMPAPSMQHYCGKERPMNKRLLSLMIGGSDSRPGFQKSPLKASYRNQIFKNLKWNPVMIGHRRPGSMVTLL